MVVSLTQNLTQTHALYLEWLGIKRANEAGRYQVENGNAGSKPHTPAPLEADCMDIFDTLRTLVATLGYTLQALADPAILKQFLETIDVLEDYRWAGRLEP